MKSFHWTFLALVALAATLGAYALSGDFALQVSDASVVDIQLDCPDRLARDAGLDLDALPRVKKTLQSRGQQVASAEILVDDLPNQTASGENQRVGYAFNLRTPDGNLIVSRNHTAALKDLDKRMAAHMDQAVRDYQRMAEEHGLTGKGVVVENF